MALSADTVWEVQRGGSDNNGGGFVSSASGSDYSQQASAQYNGTNLTVDGTDSTKVAPDGHTPASADVGNLVHITAGTGWTTGWYEITAQDGTNWTLDRSPASTGTSGGTWYMGGALATPGQLGKAIYDHGVGGMKAWIKTGTYTLSSASANVSGGVADFSASDLSPVYDKLFGVEGYATTRGDLGTPPTISAGSYVPTNLLTMGGKSTYKHYVTNIILDGNSQNVNGLIGHAYGYDTIAYKVLVNDADATYGIRYCTAIQCKCSSCSADAFTTCNSLRCVSDHCQSGFSEGYVSHCIAANGSGYGFVTMQGPIHACVAYKNTNGGFKAYNSTRTVVAVNCMAVRNGSYGFLTDNVFVLIGCASYLNTSGRINGSAVRDYNALLLTDDPFVDGDNCDFRLDTSGADYASLKGQGVPVYGQTDYRDIGAVQHTDAGGGGTTIYSTGRGFNRGTA